MIAAAQHVHPFASSSKPERIISAREVSKVYRTSAEPVTALSAVDFDIADGELVSFVGPSGCGKSTLLRMLAGLARPTSGVLSVRGEPLRGPGAKVAVVFQQPVLLPWRTILENVLLPIEFRELPVARFRERACALLDSVGLGDFMHRHPHELSGGMQQRASIVPRACAGP